KTAMAQTAVEQAAIACAVERFRLAHGRVPDDLNALLPQFISPLPKECLTGQPYHYRRINNDSFVLYSVGLNEKDDGGVPGKSVLEDAQGYWIWQYQVAQSP